MTFGHHNHWKAAASGETAQKGMNNRMQKRTEEFDIRKFHIDDDFWGSRQKLVTDVVIPYQEKILNDEIPGVEKSHALANFRIAAGLEEGDFYGMVFQDSDVAKWLEGVAYSLAISPDSELERRADAVIEWIAAAQQPDGYLDTYFIVKEPEKKFQNLQECHELYCAGHMMEAAAAYYEATGKDKLLTVMQREADCIRRHIGPQEGQIHGIPGHEEVEIGLLRLYETAGREEDRELAEFFLDQRGVNPEYFAQETQKRGWVQWENSPHDTDYNQSYAPVREQNEARGHSVRAMYLYTAMAQDAGIRGDEDLMHACERLWTSAVDRQMYLTGGLGQAARWEGFTHAYDLPNDTAYAETCASIGLVMFAHQMLKLKTDRKYADIMERALYNGILSGMQLDGQRFFYVNPLEVVPGVSGVLPGYEHVLPQRPEWFPCACCPPNVVRLVTSLGKYAWDEREGIVYSHLFIGGEASLKEAELHVESGWPWEGTVRYKFGKTSGRAFVLAIRIPSYSCNRKVLINGEEIPCEEKDLQQGYLFLNRIWKEGDCVELRSDFPVRRIYANPLIRADENCIALMRGPLVYCMEGIDNGGELQNLRIPIDVKFTLTQGEGEDGLPDEIVRIRFQGMRVSFHSDDLYSEQPPREEKLSLQAIPYYAWGNRGINQMRVWMPQQMVTI